MTWAEARVALQLEAELRVGELMRYHANRERAIEDAAMEQLTETLGGSRR